MSTIKRTLEYKQVSKLKCVQVLLKQYNFGLSFRTAMFKNCLPDTGSACTLINESSLEDEKIKIDCLTEGVVITNMAGLEITIAKKVITCNIIINCQILVLDREAII